MFYVSLVSNARNLALNHTIVFHASRDLEKLGQWLISLCYFSYSVLENIVIAVDLYFTCGVTSQLCKFNDVCRENSMLSQCDLCTEISRSGNNFSKGHGSLGKTSSILHTSVLM